jgi:hypothetical protein
MTLTQFERSSHAGLWRRTLTVVLAPFVIVAYLAFLLLVLIVLVPLSYFDRNIDTEEAEQADDRYLEW